MKARWIGGAAIALVGCGGSASLVLKTPVSSRCEQAGLLGCEELASGVLLYAEGKVIEGAPKLRAGAAQNSPEKVKQFADQLKTLSSLPGAGKYAAAMSEVAATLVLSHPNTNAEGQSENRENGRARPPSSVASPDARGFLTADTDVSQHRSGTVELPTDPPEWCEKFGKVTSCIILGKGPLFLTDARPSAPDCKGQFLALVTGGRVDLELQSPLTLHGARILIPKGAALVLGQRAQPEAEEPISAPASERSEKSPNSESNSKQEPAPRVAEGEGVLDETPPEWSCSLYFSGFVPYDAEAATPGRPSSTTERPPEKSWNQNGGF